MNKDTDKFEISKKNPFLTKKNNKNFFIIQDSTNESSNSISISSESYRRLNDYDSNILQADAYKNVSDDVFKLEYKISVLEEELKSIDVQIQVARDISDYDTIEALIDKKNNIQTTYNSLIAIYNEKSLSARITESISSIFGLGIKPSINTFRQKFSDITDKFLLKLPKPFAMSVELKKSLNKLENINKSVDNLIAYNSEQSNGFNKYEQLTRYIVKANSIQNNIKKFIK